MLLRHCCWCGRGLTETLQGHFTESQDVAVTVVYSVLNAANPNKVGKMGLIETFCVRCEMQPWSSTEPTPRENRGRQSWNDGKPATIVDRCKIKLDDHLRRWLSSFLTRRRGWLETTPVAGYRHRKLPTTREFDGYDRSAAVQPPVNPLNSRANYSSRHGNSETVSPVVQA